MSNIYQSIASAWAADATLNGLLPSTSIATGRKEDAQLGGINADLPYVVIETPDEQLEGRTSKATRWQEQVQITIFCATLTEARRVQKRARTVLDAMTPTIDDGTLISWTRQSGGRAVESGGVGMATDVYVLHKQQDR